MWICPNDDTRNNDTDAYCACCGQRRPSVTNHMNRQTQETEKNTKKPEMTGIWIAVGALAAVILLLATGSLNLPWKTSKNTSAPTPEPESNVIIYMVPEPTVNTQPQPVQPQVQTPVWIDAQDNANLNLYRKLNVSSAAASSELGNHYIAKNVIDGSLSTSWQEAAKGYGIGEYVVLYFDSLQQVDMITIWPGYHPYYKQNGRPHEVQITLSDGTSFYAELADKDTEQYIVLPYGILTDSIKVSISTVFEGTSCDDTCITELAAYVKK